jgi:hypothetical protein
MERVDAMYSFQLPNVEHGMRSDGCRSDGTEVLNKNAKKENEIVKKGI